MKLWALLVGMAVVSLAPEYEYYAISIWLYWRIGRICLKVKDEANGV